MEKKMVALDDRIVIPVMLKHGIDRTEAEARINLLYQSGILLNGHPDDPETQRMIDDFLSLDSKESSVKVLFEKTLNECLENRSFVKNYERLTKRNLTQVMTDAENGKRPDRAEKEFRKFANFVQETVFNPLLTSLTDKT